MTDNLDRVRAEAERRKQRAWQLGLPDLMTRFYLDLARFYPAWRENNPTMVPQLITDIREVGKDAVEFLYQDHRYSLIWEERSFTPPDGNVYFSATLRLLVDESGRLQLMRRLTGNAFTPNYPANEIVETIDFVSAICLLSEWELVLLAGRKDIATSLLDEMKARGIFADSQS